jgi:hypothetical protein
LDEAMSVFRQDPGAFDQITGSDKAIGSGRGSIRFQETTGSRHPLPRDVITIRGGQPSARVLVQAPGPVMVAGVLEASASLVW